MAGAQESVGALESFKAGADLRNYEGYAVYLSAEDTVSVCASASAVVLGILKNKPYTGQAAAVALREGDIVKVITDGTQNSGISVGDALGTHTNGKLIRKSADKDYYVGRALQASTADGTVISMLIEKGYLAV